MEPVGVVILAFFWRTLPRGGPVGRIACNSLVSALITETGILSAPYVIQQVMEAAENLSPR